MLLPAASAAAMVMTLEGGREAGADGVQTEAPIKFPASLQKCRTSFLSRQQTGNQDFRGCVRAKTFTN